MLGRFATERKTGTNVAPIAKRHPKLNRLIKRHPKCLSNSQSDTYARRFDDIAELCLGSIRNVADADSPRHHRRNDFREARVLANGIVPRE
jgi:hypothetical protein